MLAIFSILVCGPVCSEAQNINIKWKLINEKENVKVYSTEVPGSDILKIKTETIIEASISKVQAILDNVEHRKKTGYPTYRNPVLLI